MAAAAVGDSVQGLKVAITGGQVLVTGKVQFAKRWVPVTLKARPQAENGKLRLLVTGAYIGRLPAPGSAKRDVQKKLDELTARALSRLPGARVTSVQVTEGQIVIQGKISGRR